MPYRPPDSYGPLQLIPPGLLGFLNLKSNGDNPHSLLAEYRPTLEMRDWMFQAKQEDINGTGLVLVTGNLGTRTAFAVPLQVPQGEWWYVHSAMASSAGLPAADLIAGAIGWVVGNPGNFANHIVGPVETVAGAANKVELFRSDRGFFMPPGALLGIFISQATFAVNHTMFMWAQITRLPA